MIFRYAVYFNSIVKRPLSSGNAVHIIISVLTLSIILQIISIFLFWLISDLASWGFRYNYDLGVAEFNSKLFIFYNNTRHNPINFVLQHYFIALSYFITVLFTTLLSALAFGYIARQSDIIGRLLFGPLAHIMVDPISPVVQCFVLTKISHEKNRIMYGGYAIEIALKDGSNIDHIVLEDPDKFYFRMNQRMPVTTFSQSRRISHSLSSGVLYISGDEIENVHFDQFYI